MLRKLRAAAFAALVLMGSTASAFAINCSGTTQSSSQVVFRVTNDPLSGFFIMNNSANMMCIAYDVAASMGTPNCGSGSYPLQPGSSTAAGGSFFSGRDGAFKPSVLFIISTAGSDAFSCTRW